VKAGLLFGTLCVDIGQNSKKISRRAAARPSGHVSGFTAMADHAQQQQTQKT